LRHCGPIGAVQGSRMASAEGRFVGPNGKLYARVSTTCFNFDTP
jgi:hypothetical protein